jgi:hypothetical protein
MAIQRPVSKNDNVKKEDIEAFAFGDEKPKREKKEQVLIHVRVDPELKLRLEEELLKKKKHGLKMTMQQYITDAINEKFIGGT